MGNSQSKVELYTAIRRDHLLGMSLRSLQRVHNVTWRTVRRAVDGKQPDLGVRVVAAPKREGG